MKAPAYIKERRLACKAWRRRNARSLGNNPQFRACDRRRKEAAQRAEERRQRIEAALADYRKSAAIKRKALSFKRGILARGKSMLMRAFRGQ